MLNVAYTNFSEYYSLQNITVPSLENSVLFLLYLGSSCRTRVTKHLSPQFKTLSEAEDALQIDYLTSGFYFGNVKPSSTPQRPTAPILDNPLSPVFQCSRFVYENCPALKSQ